MPKSQFIYILGPTGVGKTNLSIELASSLGWPIINCDSVQVYREVNIGTAKPTVTEMSSCPHYLFDYVEAPRTLTAADYIQDVATLIEEKKIKNALFVGGSGFYVQALEKGLFPKSKPSPELRAELDNWIEQDGILSLYKWLKLEDPTYAAKISKNDTYRIRRAVEVMRSQKKSITTLIKDMSEKNYSLLPKNQSLKFGLRMDKKKLRPHIEERTGKMLNSGFIDEVKTLRAKGLKEWAPMQSVGYKEVQLFLDGELPETELFERIVISTMQLIKKQMTWFKRDQEIQWFESGQSEIIKLSQAWIDSQK